MNGSSAKLAVSAIPTNLVNGLTIKTGQQINAKKFTIQRDWSSASDYCFFFTSFLPFLRVTKNIAPPRVHRKLIHQRLQTLFACICHQITIDPIDSRSELWFCNSRIY